MKRKMPSTLRSADGCGSKPYDGRPKMEKTGKSDHNTKEGCVLFSEAAAPAGCNKSSSTRFPIRKGCTRPIEQEVLQREWERLGAEEQAMRRAQRARRGERCTECGCVGYFRRNCPACPPVRFDVRKDRWRLLTAQEIEERTQLHEDRRFCSKADECSQLITIGKRHRLKTENAPFNESDEHNFQRGTGRGFLWGPLAEVAVNAAIPAADMGAKSYGDGSCGTSGGATTLATPRGESAESRWQLRPGTTFEGGSLASVTLGAGMTDAGVTVIIPSLSGSSDLSSGVISGFRRALIRADGGVATVEACPSIVSSLNDIPGRDGENTFSQRDRLDADVNTESPGRMDGADWIDETVGYADGVGGIGIGSGGGGVDASNSGRRANAVATDDDEHLLRQKLTWRWPEFSSCAPPSPASPPPPTISSGVAETVVLSPPRKAPKGSYLRQRGTTVRTIQENLHLALARLAEAIREQARSVSSSGSSAGEMLRGPRGGEPPEQYYGASTRKEFRDFFDDEEKEAARRQQPKAYAYLGGLREVGKAKYVFDRTSHSPAEKGALAAHLRGDYEPRAQGYRGTNVHSVTDWRRPNTSLDRHAISGRDAMALVAESDRTLKSQGVWVRQQTKAREQRRQRANHMLEVYRSELRLEQLREIEVLRLSPREQHVRAAKTMQDQVAAADRIMRTIARYGLAGNMEDAHYITYTADAARRAGLSQDAERTKQPGGHCTTGHRTKEKASTENLGGQTDDGRMRKRQETTGDSADGDERVPPGHASQNGAPVADINASDGRKGERGLRLASDKVSADEKMSPYSLTLTRPLPAAMRPKFKAKGSAPTLRPTQNAAAAAARSDTLQSERLRTFRLAGHPLRRGVTSDTTAVPALIPIPEGLGNANGDQKSYTAARIVEALRKSQVDSITGRRSKLAVPLWHRATEDLDSGAGSVLYSDLIGHTYSVLVGPKRATGTAV